MFTIVAAFILVVLLRKADADVTYTDLPGVYQVAREGFHFCGKRLNIETSGNTVISMTFDGEEQCTGGTLDVQNKRVYLNSSESLTFGTVDSASIGTVLVSEIFVCKPSFLVTMGLLNPPKTVKSTLPGDTAPFEFHPGIKYIIITEEGRGACVYQERGTSPSPPNGGMKERTGSPSPEFEPNRPVKGSPSPEFEPNPPVKGSPSPEADAGVTYTDLPGVYQVAREGFHFCGKTLNIKTSGNTVTSMTFDGEEQCGGGTLDVQKKRVDSSSSESLTFGTVDSASIGTVLVSPVFVCKPSFLVTMGLLNPPKTVKSTLPGDTTPFEFHPGIKYIIITEEGRGACVYQERGTSPSPPNGGMKERTGSPSPEFEPNPRVKGSPSPEFEPKAPVKGSPSPEADAGVTYTDLPGVYQVAREGFHFCGKTLNIKTSGNTVTSMTFDGEEQCGGGTLDVQKKRVDSSSSESLTFGTVDSASIGTVLVSPVFVCKPSFLVTMGLLNPPKTVKSTLPGDTTPFEFHPGIKYIIITEEGRGACVYQERGTSPSPPNGGMKERTGSPSPEFEPNPPAKGSLGPEPNPPGGDSGIWVWLGPIIAVVATIIAVFIAVYCVRRGNSSDKDFDVLPTPPVVPPSPTSINGEAYINVG